MVLGDAQLDPVDGQGLTAEMGAFLADPRLRDPRPVSDGGRLDADPGHRGDPGLDTVDWPAAGPEGGPGNLRLAYVLPSAALRVEGAGVLWPAPGDPLAADVEAAGPHRLVWVDLSP